jgi:long-chain acyl-CoA synthetase
MAIGTIAELIRNHGARQPDKLAIIAGDRRITYAELDARSSQVANAMAAEGVGVQDHVAFLDKNSPEHLEVVFGAAKLNAISVAVNWRLAPPEVAYIVNDADAKVLVVGEEFAPVLDAIADQLETVTKVVVIGSHPRFESYDAWVDRQSVTDPGAQSTADDVSLQLYSSGTTGRPKGVMLTNGNLFTALPNAQEGWRFHPDAVSLVAMPLFHIGGGGWALASMYQGGTVVLHREVDPAAIVRDIPEHRITHAFIVPAVIQFMQLVPGASDGDYSSLELVLYGASPISEQVLVGAMGTFGEVFMQAYGLTETTGQVVSMAPGDHDPGGARAHLLRAAGTADTGVELRIVDPATLEDVPTGVVGEILVRSALNMKGYWKLPEETAKTLLPDGWLRTGDAGYLDEEGYLFIHDRVKDMIVSGGENVYPAEIENVLMAHPAVADAAVIGVPHERWGETPKALVVRVPGVEVTEQELIDHCRTQLAKYKCPTSVDWIDSLPRNPSGKILKKDLRAPYWEGRERYVS